MTDAQVVLGRLDADKMLGGDLPLNADLAHKAVEAKVAKPLGLSITEAALGIIKVINSNMALAIRSNSVARGIDPREFALVPFGGAGPLHGVALAEAISAKEIIVPVAPGITAAMGLLQTDMQYEHARSLDRFAQARGSSGGRAHQCRDRRTGRALPTRSGEGRRDAGAAEIPKARGMPLSRSGISSCAHNFPDGQGDRRRIWREVVAGFHQQHRLDYGYHFEDGEVELITVRVIGREDVTPLKVARDRQGRRSKHRRCAALQPPDDVRRRQDPRDAALRPRPAQGRTPDRRTGDPDPAQLDDPAAARLRRRGGRIRQSPHPSRRLRAIAAMARQADRSDHAAGHQRRLADDRRGDGACPLPHVLLLDHPRIAGSRRRTVRHRFQHAVRVGIDAAAYRLAARLSRRHPRHAAGRRMARRRSSSFTIIPITARAIRRTSPSWCRFSTKARWSAFGEYRASRRYRRGDAGIDHRHSRRFRRGHAVCRHQALRARANATRRCGILSGATAAPRASCRTTSMPRSPRHGSAPKRFVELMDRYGRQTGRSTPPSN